MWTICLMPTCKIYEPAVSNKDTVYLNLTTRFRRNRFFCPNAFGLSLTLCFRHKKAAGDSRGLKTEMESLRYWWVVWETNFSFAQNLKTIWALEKKPKKNKLLRLFFCTVCYWGHYSYRRSMLDLCSATFFSIHILKRRKK